MALPGVSVEVGLLVLPSDKFTFPGAHRDTSGRLPGCCSVSESHLTLCDPMDCSTPGFPGLLYLLVFAQTHGCCYGDAIQPSHPLSSPSPPAFNVSQHQDLFQGVSFSHQVARVLELQRQSFSIFSSVQFSSVAQSCPTLCDPMNHSTPGLPVHHHLPEFTQTHVH